MINLCGEEKNCCGCSACMSICPNNAITMVENEKGFMEPQINKDKCVECGLCLKVCDFKVFKPTEGEPKAYAFRYMKDKSLETSRSGAAAAALADEVIAQGGVVFGAQIIDNNIIHKMESDEDGCSCFKGSKYVQSNMGNCFVECKNELNKGRLVLFTGTGCQIHGLLRYLDVANVSTDRLYTMDLVCHGTPSPGVWKQYIMEYEKRSGTKVIDVNFRDKNVKGWGAHIEKYKFSDGNEINNEKWATVFYRHVMFRESCYNCKYTTTNRKSDITVADFWGVGKVLPELDDNRGVSLVLVHSEKGKEIFNALCKKVIVKEVPLKKCMQPQLMHPAEKKYDYNFFWMLYKKNHQKAVCFYFFPSFPASILFSIETMLKKLKKVLKKLITRK